MTSKLIGVYRYFDADNRLLYIGSSLNLPKRFSQHKLSSAWEGLSNRVEVENYDTIEEARYEEKMAIYKEYPKYNVVHNDQIGRVSLTPRDLKDYDDNKSYITLSPEELNFEARSLLVYTVMARPDSSEEINPGEEFIVNFDKLSEYLGQDKSKAIELVLRVLTILEHTGVNGPVVQMKWVASCQFTDGAEELVLVFINKVIPYLEAIRLTLVDNDLPWFYRPVSNRGSVKVVKSPANYRYAEYTEEDVLKTFDDYEL